MLNSSSSDKTDVYLSKEAVLSMRIEDTLTSETSSVYHSKSSKKLGSFSLSSTPDDHLYIDNNCKCALHDRSRIKFYNRPRSQPNRCICTSQRYYNCNYCTSNYPISVRRSKDGEESDHHHSNKLKSVYGKAESSGGSQSPKVHLKPSPLPVSSHLIALLTLTNPSNKFIPPPNKNLANVTQIKEREAELLLFD